MRGSAPLMSIIVPAYREEAGLSLAVERIRKQVTSLCKVEFLLVDDGSEDDTWRVIQGLAAAHADIEGIRMSRNFGKEAAISAGMKLARGDLVVTIDADLQHPPELLHQMYAAWLDGAKVVNAVKHTRENESQLKAWMTRSYFRLFQRLAGIDVGNASDFKLLDREVVDCLNGLPERERFYRGLVGWVGFDQRTVKFDVAPRIAGAGKWSTVKLMRLALGSIVSFSTAPMHLMTALGGLFALLSVSLGARTFWLWASGAAVPGFTTVILLLIVIGSLLMLGLGIIGLYIAKIYEEVKRRPEFIVQESTAQAAWTPGIERDHRAPPSPLDRNALEHVREASR